MTKTKAEGKTGSPFLPTLLQMPLTVPPGGSVTFNPAQVISLQPLTDTTCIVKLTSGTHFTLGCSYDDAFLEITGDTPPIPVGP